jgi:hypothetical protein
MKHSFQCVTGEWFVENDMFQLYRARHTNGEIYEHGLSPGAVIRMAAAVPVDWLMPLELHAGFLESCDDQLVRKDHGGQWYVSSSIFLTWTINK